MLPCGHENAGVVGSLGAWGIRWIGELGDTDLDPHRLMWDIRRTISVDAWPRARTVVEFRLAGVDRRAAHGWLMVSEGVPDVCDFDPGYEVAATVEASLLTLTQIWRGALSWSRAMLNGSVTIPGPTDARRAVPSWLGQSLAAAVPRPA